MAGKYFTPEQDVIGEEPDGRTYIIAHGGVPILHDKALKLGIVPGERTEATDKQSDEQPEGDSQLADKQSDEQPEGDSQLAGALGSGSGKPQRERNAKKGS